jgi:hypothetical protein
MDDPNGECKLRKLASADIGASIDSTGFDRLEAAAVAEDSTGAFFQL